MTSKELYEHYRATAETITTESEYSEFCETITNDYRLTAKQYCNLRMIASAALYEWERG